MQKATIDEFLSLVYPQERLEVCNEKLLEYYQESYSKKYYQLLKRRMDRTIYLLGSNPEETYKFMLKHQDYIFDWEHFEIIKTYYDDFKSLKKHYKQEKDFSLYQSFCTYHNIKENDFIKKKEEILLHIEDLASLQSYKNMCEELGIRELNENEFLSFLKLKSQLEQKESDEIIKRSLWSNDIKDELQSIGVVFNYTQLGQLLSLRNNKEATCHNLGVINIVHVPLIEKYNTIGNVDKLFLHENRHAIESNEVVDQTKTIIGIYSEKTNLKLLNEIRTELHAIEDNENLPTIFSKRSQKQYASSYQALFTFYDYFFEYYEYLLDSCSIENDLRKLFSIFNKDDLLLYEELFKNSYEELFNFYASDIRFVELDREKHLELEKKLISNAIKSGYEPYQK